MAPRYYRVIMGHRGDTAKERFLTWLRTRGQERVGTRGNGRARPPKIALHIIPFAFDLAVGQYVIASAEAPAWTRVSGVAPIASRTRATINAGSTILPLKKIKPARVVIKTGASGTGTDKSSHITGLTYKDYGGTSFSVPFGKLNETDSEVEARTAIKAALIAGSVATGSNIRFQEEDI